MFWRPALRVFVMQLAAVVALLGVVAVWAYWGTWR